MADQLELKSTTLTACHVKESDLPGAARADGGGGGGGEGGKGDGGGGAAFAPHQPHSCCTLSLPFSWLCLNFDRLNGCVCHFSLVAIVPS